MSVEEIEPDPGPLALCECGGMDGTNFMNWTADGRWICRRCWRRENPRHRCPMPLPKALRKRLA